MQARRARTDGEVERRILQPRRIGARRERDQPTVLHGRIDGQAHRTVVRRQQQDPVVDLNARLRLIRLRRPLEEFCDELIERSQAQATVMQPRPQPWPTQGDRPHLEIQAPQAVGHRHVFGEEVRGLGISGADAAAEPVEAEPFDIHLGGHAMVEQPAGQGLARDDLARLIERQRDKQNRDANDGRGPSDAAARRLGGLAHGCSIGFTTDST